MNTTVNDKKGHNIVSIFAHKPDGLVVMLDVCHSSQVISNSKSIVNASVFSFDNCRVTDPEIRDGHIQLLSIQLFLSIASL